MSDLDTLQAMLERAQIPHRVRDNLWSKSTTILEIGDEEGEAPTIFGLGGGYVGMFGFDVNGQLCEFGVLA